MNSSSSQSTQQRASETTGGLHEQHYSVEYVCKDKRGKQYNFNKLMAKIEKEKKKLHRKTNSNNGLNINTNEQQSILSSSENSNVNILGRQNDDIDMLDIPEVPAAFDTGSNDSFTNGSTNDSTNGSTNSSTNTSTDSSMNQDGYEHISVNKNKSISDEIEKQHREYTEIVQGLRQTLPDCNEDTYQDITQSMGYTDPDSLIVVEEDEEILDSNDSEDDISDDDNNQNASNNSSGNNNRKSLSNLKSLHVALVDADVQAKNVSKKTPLKMSRRNIEECTLKSGCNIGLFIGYINGKLSSLNIEDITKESMYTELFRLTTLQHFTVDAISTLYRFMHIYHKYLPIYNQIQEACKDDMIYMNCDGQKYFNKCRKMTTNISKPLLIGMSKKYRAIFTVFDSVDYRSDTVNELYSSYKNKSPNDNNDTADLRSTVNAVFVNTKLDKMKGYGPRLDPDILLFPYTSLILYLQQILLIPGCIDSFCNKTKNDISNIVKEYNTASKEIFEAVRVRKQNQVLLKYKIGLFGLMKLKKILSKEFDYCISIAVHSDGAGTNSTFNEFSAESTYIIQVEILSTSRTDDNFYNHIVYASSGKIQNIAYYMLMQEIQVLKQGMDMFVNMRTSIEKKKIIIYQDMIKGDYKEITDLVGYCSPSSKMPYYLDYTIAKTSAEIFFLMSFMNTVQLYYKNFIDILNNTGLPDFKVYTLGDDPLESIQMTNLVPHTFKKCYLYRTNESIDKSFQCDVKGKSNIKKLKTNQLFYLFLGKTLFYTFCIDVFHIDYNISKRLSAILFAFSDVKKINQAKHDELLELYPDDYTRFFHVKLNPKGLDYFKFQINGDIMDNLTTVLQSIRSPYFGFSMTKMKFDRDIITKMIIVDYLNLFAVVIPLCFESLSIDDCHILHSIYLFSTIIKMHFDTTFDINDPKYEYKRRIDNFLYELYFILHENLYIDCMHLLEYSPDIFKLHNRADTLCARNERAIKAHKPNIHQSSNKGKTAIINQSEYEIARIHEAYDEQSNATNLSTTEQENNYKLTNFSRNLDLYKRPIVKSFLMVKYKDMITEFMNDHSECNEDNAYMRWIKDLKRLNNTCTAKNIRSNKYSFNSYNPNDRSDKCMVRLKEKIDLMLKPDYPNNIVNQGTLFGRLIDILKIQNDIYFIFDKIYVTTPKPDSCIFNDFTDIKYIYDTSKLKLIYSTEEVDLLPVAYLSHEVVFEYVQEISSDSNTITNYYKKVSFYDRIYNKQRIETSGNIYTYTITSFIIDSHSHFDK